MNVMAFDPMDHIHYIQRWLSGEKMAAHLAEDLPQLGFIAFDDGEALAAGFLRRVEGHHAILDSLIANPERLGSKKRSEAIDRVVEAIIQISKELKIKQLIATAKSSGVVRRSFKHGFKKHPDALITMNLGEEL